MDARPGRRTAVLAFAAAILVATPVAATDTGAEQSAVPTEAAPLLDGTWRQLADPPFGSIFGAGAWTGEEVLVIDVPSGRVASYGIATDAWTELSAGPEDVGPEGLGVLSPTVWTGRELLLFDNTLFDRTHGSDKAYAFDPTTSTWRDLAPMPFVPSFAVWADTQAIIADPQRHVAAYDPELDVWTELPRAPGAKELQGLFWSGTELLAVTTPKNRGVASIATLVLGSKAWGPPIEGPVSEAVANEGLWAGDRLLFTSGGTIPGVVTDATFDPAAETWTVRDDDCVGSAIGFWNGELVISGDGSKALDPSTGQCYAFPGSEIADAFNERRNGAARVWTGHELILWSGDQGGEGGPPTLEAVSFTPGERQPEDADPS